MGVNLKPVSVINLNRDCLNAYITECNLHEDKTLDPDKTYVVNCLLTYDTVEPSLLRLIKNSDKDVVITGCINPYIRRCVKHPRVDSILEPSEYSNLACPFNFLMFGKIIAVRATEGCSGTCTFCNIRNHNRYSYPISQLIDSIDTYMDDTDQNILLVGNEGTVYDNEGMNILDVVEALHIRYGCYVSVQHWSSDFITAHYDRIRELIRGHVMQSLGLSIQSASPKIHTLMGRNADLDQIYRIFSDIREYCPEDFFTYSEFIYGFYSETEEDLLKSVSYAQVFDYVIWFKYAQLAGSEAESLYPNHITGTDYSNMIHTLGNTLGKNPIIITSMGYKNIVPVYHQLPNMKEIRWVIY